MQHCVTISHKCQQVASEFSYNASFQLLQKRIIFKQWNRDENCNPPRRTCRRQPTYQELQTLSHAQVAPWQRRANDSRKTGVFRGRDRW